MNPTNSLDASAASSSSLMEMSGEASEHSLGKVNPLSSPPPPYKKPPSYISACRMMKSPSYEKACRMMNLLQIKEEEQRGDAVWIRPRKRPKLMMAAKIPALGTITEEEQEQCW
ncbi:hypothetical protein [Candidatus Ichthyocystis hellenicum]|uniref:hypothetical protein n=1 Tax=Candidatus Ichthyocystis hellenicum TaxID=1561003 RepID=UPI000B85A175|nr:hypothetical protein [Candidatus Ichthyocystis hellenicum]